MNPPPCVLSPERVNVPVPALARAEAPITELVLEKDWTFPLYFEYRNEIYGRKQGIKPPRVQRGAHSWETGWRQRDKSVQHTIPAGTILIVDRVYIRKGKDMSKYSSLTFRCYTPPTGKAKKPKSIGRFWAKLADVNRIEATL